MYDQKKRILQTTVTRNESVTQGARLVTFVRDSDFSYQPGQYVWVELPQYGRRAFAVVTSPDEPTEKGLSVVFRETDSPYMQALAHLTPDAPVVMHGPFGSAFDRLLREPRGSVVLAGGIGITPFLPIMRTLAKQGTKEDMHMVCFNSEPSRAFGVEELSTLAKDSGAFELRSITGPFAWEAVGDIADLQTREWYITGPQAFVDAAGAALAAHGVDFSHIHCEQYWPSTIHGVIAHVMTHAPSSQYNSEDKLVAQLAEERNILRSAIEDSTNHIIVTGSNGVIHFANKAAQVMTGYSFEEMRTNTPRLWGGMMSAEFYAHAWDLRRQGKTFSDTLINRRKNGELYHAKVHISPIFDRQHTCIGFIGTEEDITKEVLLGEKFSTLVEQLPVGVVMTSAATHEMLVMNKRAVELVGKGPHAHVAAADYSNTFNLITEAGGPYPSEELTTQHCAAGKSSCSQARDHSAASRAVKK